MASKRQLNNRSRQSKEREEYDNYLQASLEVLPIEWNTDGDGDQQNNTPPLALTRNDKDRDCKQRKLSHKTDIYSKRHSRHNQGRHEPPLRTKIKKKGVSMATFSDVIDEIVLSIFSYLPRQSLVQCAHVCHRWRRLGYDRLLWRQVNFDSKKFTKEGVLGAILNRGVKVLRLSRAEILAPVFSDDCMGGVNLIHDRTGDDDNYNEDDDDDDDILSLTHLDCSMSKFNDEGLSDILYKCKDLQNLSLEGCKVDQSVVSAITMNRRLEVLNVALTIGLNPCSVDIVTRNCKYLTSVNLSWTNQTRDSIRYLCRCKNLTSLNLAGLRGGINRVYMEMLVMNLKKLQELDFSDVTLQVGSLKLIADNLILLKKLSVSRCTDVRSEQLLDLQNLRSLSHLNLFGFLNSAALEQFSERRPDIHINKNHLSPIARPIISTTYEGKLWEQYVGFII